MGRVPKYKDAKTLDKKCNEYFQLADEMEKPYTFSGLAYHLGFLQRHSLNQYAIKGDELSVPIKKAMLRIESGYEERLHGHNCTGSIFALKNRGWSDKTEMEHSGEVKVTKSWAEVMGGAEPESN